MPIQRLYALLLLACLSMWAAIVTAQSPVLVSISVTPATPTIPSGSTQQFLARGTYSDGSSQSLTLAVTWSSSNTASATIGSTGVAIGLAPGASTITATSGSISGTTSAIVADTNLAGWWRFDDGTGAAGADISGNGDPATLVNGIVWTTGQIGQAISANGSSQYAQIPAVNLSTTRAITWMAWINRSWDSGTETLLENSANFNSSATGFGFFPDDSGDCGLAGTLMTGVHGDVGYTLNCYRQPSSGVWHHIAAVYDKSQAGPNVISLYIDGVLQSPAVQPYTATNTNFFGSNVSYVFSRGGASQFTSGEIDDLRIYNQALTAAQIGQIYLQGLGTLTSIAVTPANGSVARGGTQQMTAIGTYSNGTPQNLSSLVTWSSSNTTVATISAAGLAMGVSAGATNIVAVYGAISGSTALTVNPPTLQSISVTPGNQTITTGDTEQYTATGTYSDGSVQNLTTSVTWTSMNPSVATISTSGLARAIARGTTFIEAASGSVVGNTELDVVNAGATLVSIAVTPATFSLLPGGTQQMTATGTYSDGSTQNLTSSVTWSSTSPAVATVNASGLVTGVAAGSATIRATSGSMIGSAQATVPSASNLAGWWTFNQGSGNSVPDASGNGNSAALMNGISWVTGQNGYAIAANGANQYVQIPATNLSSTHAITWTAWVNRTWTSGATTLIENSANFNGSTTGFGFFPDDSADCRTSGTMMTGVHGNVGYTLSCYRQPSSGVWHHIAVVYDKTQAAANVTSLYIDGVLQTPVSQPYSATNTNTFGSNPTYLFARGGSGEFAAGELYDLRLFNQALTAAQIQQIYQPDMGSLVSITVAPANLSIPQGRTQQYTATGNYSNGGTADMTGSVTWSSSNTAVATINSAGVATAAGVGMTNIQATASSLTGAAGLTVTAAPSLVSLTVSPANVSLSPGGTQQMTATGTYSDGSTQNLTGSVTWSSTSTTVATVNASGLVTALAAGSATIRGVYQSMAGTSPVTVTAVVGKYVQFASGDGGSTTSETIYQDRPATSGNLMLAFSHWNNPAAAVTVQDQLGNTYTPIFPATCIGGSDCFQVWYAKNIKGGTELGLTFHYSARTTNFSVVDIIEYAGLDTTNPLDVFASATGTGFSQNSGKMPMTTSAAEIIIGLFGYSGYALPYTAGSGFTFRNYDASTMLEDRAVNSIGVYNATATSANSANWAAFAIAFRTGH